MNKEKFGVKSTFKTGMSQYTTILDVKRLTAEQVPPRAAPEDHRSLLPCLFWFPAANGAA